MSLKLEFVDLSKPVRSRNDEYAERGRNRLLRQRRWLPYGMWTCADGREVLFNRSYAPIWQRLPGKSAEKANHGEWVPWVQQDRIFDDRTSPWRDSKNLRRVQRVLCDFLCGEPMHPEKW